MTTAQQDLAALSDRIAAAGDAVAPETIAQWIGPAMKARIQDPSWAQLYELLVTTLESQRQDMRSRARSVGAIRIIDNGDVTTIERQCRLLLLCDLLTTLMSEDGKPESERTIRSAADVRAALVFRKVALPSETFSRMKSVLVRQPGTTDLYVVRDQWHHYIADEIASVVNVLPGETLEHRTGQLDETEVTASTSTTTQTTTTEEHSTTSSSNLSNAATQDASLNVGVQGQVETSGQYGPTHVQTSLGAQLQSAQAQSNSRASTTAIETIARATKSVMETVSTSRTVRTLQRTTTRDLHKLHNVTEAVAVDFYRWLSCVHRMQLEMYPNRYVLEFEIPEPGAWLRWALTNAPDRPWDHPDPGEFRVTGALADLTPADVTDANWQQLSGRWAATGVTPPPPLQREAAIAIKASNDSSDDKHGDLLVTDNTITVPEGYEATSWTGVYVARRDYDQNADTVGRVSVGGSLSTFPGSGFINEPIGASGRSGNLGGVLAVSSGTVPVAVYAIGSTSVAVTVQVVFTPVGATAASPRGTAYQQWQQSTYEALRAAYDARLSAFQQERQTRSQQSSDGAIAVGPPQINLIRAVAELKRRVIEDLIGTPLPGYSLVRENDASVPPGAPTVNPSTTLAPGLITQFFEQVFEWENLVYICYPYFWGGQAGWVRNATWASADPGFDQFLNAGSARVVVPARPGYENLVNYFLYTGEVWGGSNPPAPNDPLYLSVADEIQSIQKGATDGQLVGDPWEVVLPTTLLWAGVDESKLPVNSACTIGAPPSAAIQ